MVKTPQIYPSTCNFYFSLTKIFESRQNLPDHFTQPFFPSQTLHLKFADGNPPESTNQNLMKQNLIHQNFDRKTPFQSAEHLESFQNDVAVLLAADEKGIVCFEV